VLDGGLWLEEGRLPWLRSISMGGVGFVICGGYVVVRNKSMLLSYYFTYLSRFDLDC
jgi:uncharacterized membrane protein